MNSQNDTYFLREFVASHKQIFDKSNEKFIYSFSNIACLCAHIAYLIMFYILQVKELVIFNIFSVLFYFTLFVVIRLGKGGAALLYLADIEVIAERHVIDYHASVVACECQLSRPALVELCLPSLRKTFFLVVQPDHILV